MRNGYVERGDRPWIEYVREAYAAGEVGPLLLEGAEREAANEKSSVEKGREMNVEDINRFTITEISHRIFHAVFETQYGMTSTMLRMQEFYESPFAEINGHVFTIERFMDIYAADNNGVMSYFEDWHGYNLPSHVINLFCDDYRYDWQETLLTDKESRFLTAVRSLAPKRSAPYYLIASVVGEEDDGVFDHEMAHAFYYLQYWYKQEQLQNIGSMPGPTRAYLIACLKNMGYGEDVILDEIQAYLATSSREFLAEKFNINDEGFAAFQPFRDTYFQYLEAIERDAA